MLFRKLKQGEGIETEQVLGEGAVSILDEVHKGLILSRDLKEMRGNARKYLGKDIPGCDSSKGKFPETGTCLSF